MPTDTRKPSAINILRVDSSARRHASVTRRLADQLVARLLADQPGQVVVRDLAAGLPFIDADWVAANFTEADARDADMRAALALSDRLVGEVMAADVLVIGVPLYNFAAPASLKAWIDQIARARVTFRYTEHGPRGLLAGKTAFLLVASGGTEVGGAIDFATPWLRHMLAFLGIADVRVIAAERLNLRGDEAYAEALARLDAALEPHPGALAQVA